MGDCLYLALPEGHGHCTEEQVIEMLRQAGAVQVPDHIYGEWIEFEIEGVYPPITICKEPVEDDGIFAFLRVPPRRHFVEKLVEFAERLPCRIYNPVIEDYVTRDTIDRTMEKEAELQRAIYGVLGQVDLKGKTTP